MKLDPDLRALQEVRDHVAAAKAATKRVASYSQAEVDALCAAMAKAGADAAYELARTAVEETGIGRVHHKILKNLFGAEGTWRSIANEKTVGIVSRDRSSGVVEIATPVGIVAGIVPTTNPTSTALFKSIISVKGRNAIVISPHPRAKRCIAETVEVLRRALERAGGPPDLVTSLSNPTVESTGALMRHRDVGVILATGGSGLVTAAYSSGKPAYGVGPGNVPVYVDRSADVEAAARWITNSQSFDNGTFCCSEQALVIDRPIADRLLAAMVRRGAHVCDAEETEKLAKRCNVGGHMCPDVVGLDPWRVAEMSGFRVPRETSVLLAHQDGVGREHPLSIEILCPLLSVHLVDGWEEGCDVSMQTLAYGGLGHTIGLWARDPEVLDAWFLEKPANRIVVNGPASEGAVGYSTNLVASVSLGCGPQAGNITSDNISAKHLVNLKRAAFPRREWETEHARDHARAASFSGDTAPRGSGLPGDPALSAGGAPVPGPVSSVGAESSRSPSRANAPAGGATASAGSTPASTPARAPRFTQAAANSAATLVAAPPRVSPNAETKVTRPATVTGGARTSSAAAHRPSPEPGTHVGMALSPAEIRGILSHAGEGCPLGPCRGCPHHDVKTNACMA